MISLITFIAAYALFVFLPNRRTHIAIAAALILIITGTISFKDAFFAVNWNVMGIFVGTLIVADVFMESRVPAYVAEIIVDKAKNTMWAILLICLMTGFISAFVENVATVLIVAPIALALAKKLNINPHQYDDRNSDFEQSAGHGDIDRGSAEHASGRVRKDELHGFLLL
jgi:Na+/H+ antiporter NhaD/arsenite permease-like protein